MDSNDSAPAWNFFERIERLESLKPTTEDSLLLAIDALFMAFLALVRSNASFARSLKDDYVEHLEGSSLSPEVRKEVKRVLTLVCDQLDKQA